MKRTVLFCTLALTAAVSYGCSEDRPSPTEMTELQAAFGKTGGGGTDTDARAIFEFYDAAAGGQTSLIRGDGRDVSGAAAPTGSSRYQGDVCGVMSKIFWYNQSLSQSGDAVFDPDQNRTTCGAARFVWLDLPEGSVKAGFHTNVGRIMHLQVGEWRLQRMPLSSTGITGCSMLRFTDENGNDLVKVTRTSETTWTAESTGNHRAGCYENKQGTFRYLNKSYVLPFRIQITEVR